MFQIAVTPNALDDLRRLRSFDQKTIQDALSTQLVDQPLTETRQRKRLRPNQLAEWELRVGHFRVFYDVDAATKQVTIKAIGFKEGNKLILRGQEYQL